MKKFKVILCAMICILGLTACGGSKEEALSQEKAVELEQMTMEIYQGIIVSMPEDMAQELIDTYGAEGLEEVFASQLGISAQGNGIIGALNSWNSAKADLGEFSTITNASAKYDDQGSNIIVTLDIEGTNRSGQVEAIYLKDYKNTLKSLTTNVNWTFGEKMQKAGLNTLMGMGTVFVVLILISLIISLFNFIPKIQAMFSKEKNEVKAEAVENTIAQIVEKEEQTDDLELIAVITAAIAASGTSGSSDDFVVRSIRRRPNSQWNKA